MATRREVEARHSRLRHDLRQSWLEGTPNAGALVPSVPELARRYNVSVSVARQALAA